MKEILVRIDQLNGLIQEKIVSNGTHFDKIVLFSLLIIKLQLIENRLITDRAFKLLLAIAGCSHINYSGFFPVLHEELVAIYKLCTKFNQGKYLADIRTPACTDEKGWSRFLSELVAEVTVV